MLWQTLGLCATTWIAAGIDGGDAVSLEKPLPEIVGYTQLQHSSDHPSEPVGEGMPHLDIPLGFGDRQRQQQNASRAAAISSSESGGEQGAAASSPGGSDGMPHQRKDDLPSSHLSHDEADESPVDSVAPEDGVSPEDGTPAPPATTPIPSWGDTESPETHIPSTLQPDTESPGPDPTPTPTPSPTLTPEVERVAVSISALLLPTTSVVSSGLFGGGSSPSPSAAPGSQNPLPTQEGVVSGFLGKFMWHTGEVLNRGTGEGPTPGETVSFQVAFRLVRATGVNGVSREIPLYEVALSLHGEVTVASPGASGAPLSSALPMSAGMDAAELWKASVPLIQDILTNGCYAAPPRLPPGTSGGDIDVDDLYATFLAPTLITTSQGTLLDYGLGWDPFTHPSGGGNRTSEIQSGLADVINWGSLPPGTPALDALFEEAGLNLTVSLYETSVSLSYCEQGFYTSLGESYDAPVAYLEKIGAGLQASLPGVALRLEEIRVLQVCVLNETSPGVYLEDHCLVPTAVARAEERAGVAVLKAEALRQTLGAIGGAQHASLRQGWGLAGQPTDTARPAGAGGAGEAPHSGAVQIRVAFGASVPLSPSGENGYPAADAFHRSAFLVLGCGEGLATDSPDSPAPAEPLIFTGEGSTSLGIVLSLSFLGGCAMVVLVVGLQWKAVKKICAKACGEGCSSGGCAARQGEVRGTEPTHGDGHRTQCAERQASQTSNNRAPDDEDDWLVVFDPYMPVPQSQQQPTQANWDIHSNDGRPYYYNTITGKTRWDTPTSLKEVDHSDIASMTETHREGSLGSGGGAPMGDYDCDPGRRLPDYPPPAPGSQHGMNDSSTTVGGALSSHGSVV